VEPVGVEIPASERDGPIDKVLFIRIIGKRIPMPDAPKSQYSSDYEHEKNVIVPGSIQRVIPVLLI